MKLINTDDGSPTLMGEIESMHNRKGAYSETMSLYVPAFEHARSWQRPFSVGAVGFGLGYVETVLAAWTLYYQAPLSSLTSFEKNAQYYSNFNSYINGVSDHWQAAYDWIFNRVSEQWDLSVVAIKELLKGWLQDETWIQQGELSPDTKVGKFNVCIYDMFSSKTNAELWTEEFLSDFFNRCFLSPCVFSSYAATGSLKRSLKKQGFDVHSKPGFGGKRHQTFATRDVD